MTDRSGAIADGETSSDGQVADVYCTWIGTSAPYTIDAAVTLGAGATKKTVTINSSMVQGSASAGGLVVDTPDLPSNYGSSSDDPCMFTPIAVDESTRSVWGQFTCGIFAPSDMSDSCAIGTSYYSFENCTPP